jgi:hypothetical protein
MTPLFLPLILCATLALFPSPSIAFSHRGVVVVVPNAAAPSSCNRPCRPTRPTQLALAASNYDDEEDDEDLDSASRGASKFAGDKLQRESLPFQTDGGVIMPEGGANPCVIKVSRLRD